MINKAETQVLIATDSNSLIQADLDNVLNEFIQNNKIKINIVSEITASNSEYIAELLEQFSHNIKTRHIDLEEKIFPKFILTDNKEVLFIMADPEPIIDPKATAGLWTNNKSLIQAFQVLFNQMWQTGVDFDEKIQQLMHGKQPTKSIIIRDSQEAENLLISCFRQAKKEILMITTEDDLPLVKIKKDTFAEASSRGVNILILAPITEKNKTAANELSEIGAKIKHIPNSYFRAIVIDGKHLLQLKATTPTTTNQMPPNYFGSTFYTNDPEYVIGRRDLLLNMSNQTPQEIEKLRQNEAKFRSIYENTEDAILLTLPNGEVLTANTAACNMFGMSIEEMGKANRQNMLVLDQKVNEAFTNREKTGKSKAELTFRRKDGSTFQGEATASNFTDIDGKIKDCIIIRDTTQRKQYTRCAKGKPRKIPSPVYLYRLRHRHSGHKRQDYLQQSSLPTNHRI